ncbi:Ring canal kelch [Nymphon striatum]|nr:Ring canal kelch [Nymphon striatum]
MNRWVVKPKKTNPLEAKLLSNYADKIFRVAFNIEQEFPVNFMYFGGHQSNSCEYYCPQAAFWRPLPKMKEERWFAGSCYDNNKFIYVVGGQDIRNNICLTSMERFDVEIGQWLTLKSSIGVGRCGLTLTIFKNQLILIGGNDKNISFKTIQKYDSILDSEQFQVNPGLNKIEITGIRYESNNHNYENMIDNHIYFFKLEQILENVFNFMKDNLDFENVLNIRDLYLSFDQMENVVKCDKFIKNNFDKVSKAETFKQVEFIYLNHLIKSDELVVEDEKRIFEIVVEWTNMDINSRQQYGQQLLENVKFPLMSYEYLHQIVNHEIIQNGNLYPVEKIGECPNTDPRWSDGKYSRGDSTTSPIPTSLSQQASNQHQQQFINRTPAALPLGYGNLKYAVGVGSVQSVTNAYGANINTQFTQFQIPGAYGSHTGSDGKNSRCDSNTSPIPTSLSQQSSNQHQEQYINRTPAALPLGHGNLNYAVGGVMPNFTGPYSPIYPVQTAANAHGANINTQFQMPGACGSHTANEEELNEYLICIGGGENTLNSIDICADFGSIWNTYDKIDPGRYSFTSCTYEKVQHVATIINSVLFICGGFFNKTQTSKSLISLNLNQENGKWRNRKSSLEIRNGSTGCSVKSIVSVLSAYYGWLYLDISYLGKFYVFGGDESNSCEYYCPQAAFWRPLPKMKEERWNKIYLTSMERFDVEIGQWSTLKSSIGVGRDGLTLTIFKNQLILIGGKDKDNKLPQSNPKIRFDFRFVEHNWELE